MARGCLVRRMPSPLPPFTPRLRRCRPVRTCSPGSTWSGSRSSHRRSRPGWANLGLLLLRQQQIDEAIHAHRASIRAGAAERRDRAAARAGGKPKGEPTHRSATGGAPSSWMRRMRRPPSPWRRNSNGWAGLRERSRSAAAAGVAGGSDRQSGGAARICPPCGEARRRAALRSRSRCARPRRRSWPPEAQARLDDRAAGRAGERRPTPRPRSSS